jgi:flagella basal body P-ring formation protein FlgA
MIRAVQFLPVAVVLAQVALAQTPSSCVPVSTDRITGRDLAVAVPAFASLQPEAILGYSPTPGVQRIFAISELQKLATRYGIETKITAPVCFAWPLHPLGKYVLTAALLKSLAGQQVDLEIVDQCHLPVPEGEVVFPFQGLSGESSKPAIWNGYVTYSGNRKFSTWVQVRITVHEQQIVAARSIRVGELIGAADIQAATYSGPLRRAQIIHAESEVAGKCARQPIAAGTVLTRSLLAIQDDVEKQQMVTVHIRCGAAHVETQGIAVEGGYKGDVIKVKNVKTGRVFLARIDDPGVVTVVPGGDVGLVVEDKKS